MNYRHWFRWLLAALGIAYAVLATKYTIPVGTSSGLLESHSILIRLLIGPLWYVVLLPAIAIALALLDVGFATALVALFIYGLIMLATYYQITNFWGVSLRTGTFIADFIGLGFSVAVQLVVWGVLRLLLSLIRHR